jgi:hypothetical protein
MYFWDLLSSAEHLFSVEHRANQCPLLLQDFRPLGKATLRWAGEVARGLTGATHTFHERDADCFNGANQV